jgi:hypothetical protein
MTRPGPRGDGASSHAMQAFVAFSSDHFVKLAGLFLGPF